MGLIETRVMQDTGIDLYEIYRWPLRKKLVYAQHYAAWDEMQRSDEEQPEIDADDLDLDTPTPPTNRIKTPKPTGGSRKRGGTEKTRHPALRGYSNRINVQNPGEGMSQERIDEIMEKARAKYGDDGRTMEEIGGYGIDIEKRESGFSIDQAGDGE